MSKNNQEGGNGPWWYLGLLCVLGAAFFSGLLALKQLGLIGDSLPGCGPQSACDQITNGPWGRIPGLDWPVSFLGLAWFAALLVALLLSSRGISMGLRWIVRIGALLSLGFVLIMVAEGAICPYCLAAHVCNFGLWITVEMNRHRVVVSRALVGGVATFFLATIVLGIGQIGLAASQAEDAERFEDAFVAQQVATTETVPEQTSEVTLDTPGALDTPGESEPLPQSPPIKDLLASRWTWGDQDAPVQVVMISDYQCPDCQKFERDIQSVLAQRDDVSLSIKMFPMCTDCNPNLTRNMHANACWAARAAETAGILGGEGAFWEMHRWLFDNKGQFPGGRLPSLVEELGFDRQEFTEIMTSDETLDLVQGDIADGVELGLFYTPMIFINGVELKWHMLPSNLKRTVNRVADAIASGQAESEIEVPPTSIDKYVADWRDGRKTNVLPADRTFKRSNVVDTAPKVLAFIDFISPNTKTFLDELRAWEELHGPTDLELRVNPISHDCNPNLPARMQSRDGACLAARALKAAGVVGGGDKAIEMAFWLIDNGPDLGTMGQQALVDHAIAIGIDGQRFAEALNSVGVEKLVDQDVAEFKRDRFKRVPTVVVGKRVIPRVALQGHTVIGRVLDDVQGR
jgi:predicted DsbA family dithiol-disulfide isomerase/uncharacterized membrane protein